MTNNETDILVPPCCLLSGCPEAAVKGSRKPLPLIVHEGGVLYLSRSGIHVRLCFMYLNKYRVVMNAVRTRTAKYHQLLCEK